MNLQVIGKRTLTNLLGLLSAVLSSHFAFASTAPGQIRETAFNIRSKTDKNKPVFSDFTVAHVDFADMAATLTPQEKKQIRDSIERRLLDEIYISRYLRFFDGNARNVDALIFYNEDELPPAEEYTNPDSVYRERIAALNAKQTIQMAYNDRVKVYIEVYTIKKRKQLHVMLALSQYYFPIFEEALRREGLPEELKYMAVIESALNPRAVSPAGAAGIWQFMYQTGRMCHLKINTKVDERLDPIKASMAAALYLKELYNCFNDWTLAIAAYNCGPGNVNKAIRRAKGRTDFWTIFPYLPRETRGYVPAFIAAAYAINYHEEHGQCPPRHYTPILTDTLFFAHDLDLRQVADGLHMPLQILKDLNPQYKINVIPHEGGAFSLRLPASMIGDFIENKEAILSDTTWKDYYPIWEEVIISHRVRRGETLSSIAKHYGVKVDDLMSWNKLRSTVIYANQLLHIHSMREKAPRLSYTAATLPPPIDTVLDSAIQTMLLPADLHTTTVTRRPQVYDTAATVATTANPATPAANQPAGATATSKPQAQTAPQPKPQPTPQTASASASQAQQAAEQASAKGREVEYKVRKGDTLYDIWRKHPGSTIKEIISRNNLSRNGNLIYPNQILIIPVH